VGNGTGSNCRRRRRGPGSANNAAAPINRTKRIHSERPPHSPEGDIPKVYGRQFRCSGCHRLIRPNALALLDSLLPAQMEPEEGFEPSTFRLRVGCATTTPLGLGGMAERVGAEGGVYRSGWGWAREGRPGVGCCHHLLVGPGPTPSRASAADGEAVDGDGGAAESGLG
jgi:hypothetical protein